MVLVYVPVRVAVRVKVPVFAGVLVSLGTRDSVLVTDAVGVGGVPVGVTDTELVEVGL